MNKQQGRLAYIFLGGLILTALVIYSVPTASASQGGRPTIAPAMPSEEPPPTNTPAPSPTPNYVYFHTAVAPYCFGGGCSSPTGFNTLVSSFEDEQSMQAFDPSSSTNYGKGQVETSLKVGGVGIGTVSLYYSLSGISCPGGYWLIIRKVSGNINNFNPPLSGYLDVTLTASDLRSGFTIYTRCVTLGKYVGTYGIDSVWYSLVDPATWTPTPTATLTSTPTNTPTLTPTNTPTSIPTLTPIATLTITPTTQATWYTGNSQQNAYGIRANISAPAQAPFLDESGESSYVTTTGPYWIQAGWRYYGFIWAWSYVESFSPTTGYSMEEYSIHNWGNIIEYKVEWLSGSTWCGWIDGVNKACYEVKSAPSKVNAHSEVHISSQNELDTWFGIVWYLDANNTWYLFDQALWLEDAPYSVDKNHYYEFRNYGP